MASLPEGLPKHSLNPTGRNVESVQLQSLLGGHTLPASLRYAGYNRKETSLLRREWAQTVDSVQITRQVRETPLSRRGVSRSPGPKPGTCFRTLLQGGNGDDAPMSCMQFQCRARSHRRRLAGAG